jgi:dGTPase
MVDLFRPVDVATIAVREASLLAPWAARSDQSRGRKHPESPARFRTAFQRDRDRIVHSTAFRRLEYKTQVFVNHEGDHYRTRLTHTLEVAQISRSIARALRLNEDLVEAISLAHDLGHPPFGHAGEDALDELMSDWGGFDHNVQSLRVVDGLEKRYHDFDGLNLSWEIRESTIKHGRIGGSGDLPNEFEPDWSPLLEAQLADVADSLAYTNHDIDDGVRSNFLTLADLREVELWRHAEQLVRDAHPGIDDRTTVLQTVSRLIDIQVGDLISATLSRLSAHGIDSVAKVRASRIPLVGFSDDMVARTREMQSLLLERLYRHYRTLRMAEKAKRFLREIFGEYVRSPGQLPPSFQKRAEETGVPRAICDYLAGMTDRYCQEEYQRMFHPFEKL